jgi:tetratricopeptide (TPR) repeat protein
MNLPDGRSLIVDAGILTEVSSEGRVILWVPGEAEEEGRTWERLVVLPGPVQIVQGVCSVAAAGVRVRQRRLSRIARLVSRLRGGSSNRTWSLPDGTPVEQCAPRRTDRRLAWAESEAVPVEDAQIRALWPASSQRRTLGRNLYVVSGAASDDPQRIVDTKPSSKSAPPESSLALAEQELSTARARGDSGKVATALIDLGLVCLQEKDAQRSDEILKEAVALARRLGNPAQEADALSSLALTACTLRQPRRARKLLGPVLSYARSVGDRFVEKLALDRMAHALLEMNEGAAALTCFEQASAIAATLGDAQHEAAMLWRAAILYAEQGQRVEAIERAQRAVDKLRQLGNPTVDWYARHLETYRSSDPTTTRVGLVGMIDANAWMGLPSDEPKSTAAIESGPDLLRMALTATKSMAAFVGSGFRTTPTDVCQARLAVCTVCPHHTGVRCRICGCVTTVKARLLHERCPAARWPV